MSTHERAEPEPSTDEPTVTLEDAQTILVVDDDFGVRTVLRRWIGTLGFDVRVADSAESALKVMEACPVDVALCDIRMPGYDGTWLVDRIRQQFPGTPVVVATGMTEMDPAVTLRQGVVGYVVKPFKREDLARAIQEGLAWRARYLRSRPEGVPAAQRQLPA